MDQFSKVLLPIDNAHIVPQTNIIDFVFVAVQCT